GPAGPGPPDRGGAGGQGGRQRQLPDGEAGITPTVEVHVHTPLSHRGLGGQLLRASSPHGTCYEQPRSPAGPAGGGRREKAAQASRRTAPPARPTRPGPLP